MNRPIIAPYINKYAVDKKGKCPVSIKVTYQRIRKYYPTGINVTQKEFNSALPTPGKKRTEADRNLYNEIHAFENRAIEAAKKLEIFTFSKFEDIYLTNRAAAGTVSYAFDCYVDELKSQNRIGTAVSYETAKNSINDFEPKLKFADITPLFLQRYENWMLKQGKSKTTVGIYLRSLRTVFNRADIDKSLYPFGEGKGKYCIPTGRNIKKALTLEEVALIFSYEANPGTMEEMARDYWIFLYLCNGMNVKDLCLLKRKNIQGDILTYERAKTIRSKKESQSIVVSLKPEAMAVIRKWGIISISSESYLFPHIEPGWTAEREREVYQQVTKNINKYMKRIAAALGINKEVTTYFARHSFATVLKRTGASIEMIGELLGHSDVKTTRSYLAGFETEAIHKATEVLTAFNKAK